MGITFLLYSISRLVVLMYIRNTWLHRTGPIRIEKPGHSVEGELKSARLGD